MVGYTSYLQIPEAAYFAAARASSVGPRASVGAAAPFIEAARLRALLPDESLAPAERGLMLLTRVTARLAELTLMVGDHPEGEERARWESYE